ncbi:hypothetical protein CVT26_012604 [Gymnopilus dilepis]|uniref:Uncharacterized protein n=1 Tax=Gymnopilus dilepis TaxID=231916 RepID=A0A409X5M8_9AGAR|nr:hypothetical protein CVT26_012604 [Gymnopilus dilepis]
MVATLFVSELQDRARSIAAEDVQITVSNTFVSILPTFVMRPSLSTILLLWFYTIHRHRMEESFREQQQHHLVHVPPAFPTHPVIKCRGVMLIANHFLPTEKSLNFNVFSLSKRERKSNYSAFNYFKDTLRAGPSKVDKAPKIPRAPKQIDMYALPQRLALKFSQISFNGMPYFASRNA